jgi:hypothetical protein
MFPETKLRGRKLQVSLLHVMTEEVTSYLLCCKLIVNTLRSFDLPTHCYYAIRWPMLISCFAVRHGNAGIVSSTAESSPN